MDRNLMDRGLDAAIEMAEKGWSVGCARGAASRAIELLGGVAPSHAELLSSTRDVARH